MHFLLGHENGVWERLVSVDEVFAGTNDVLQSIRTTARGVVADTEELQARHAKDIPQQQNIIRQARAETTVPLLVPSVPLPLFCNPPRSEIGHQTVKQLK